MKFTLAILLLLCSCSQSLFQCGNAVNEETESPDGRYVVTVFERDCGATTDFATIVSVRRAWRTFDPDDDTALFVASGQLQISASWTSGTSLSIELPEDLSPEREFKRVESWKSVQITYHQR